MIRYRFTECEDGPYVRYSDMEADALYRSYTVEKAAYDALHEQLAWVKRLNIYAAVALILSWSVNILLMIKDLYQL